MSRALEFSRQLQLFKNEEKPEAVLLIADSPLLIKLVVAWMNMCVSRSRRPTLPPGRPPADLAQPGQYGVGGIGDRPHADELEDRFS